MKSKILPLIAGSFGIVCLLQLGNLSSANAADKPDDTNLAAQTTAKPLSDTPDIDHSGTEQAYDANDAQCLTGMVAQAILSNKEDLDIRLLQIEKREKGLEALNLRLKSELSSIEAVKANIEQHVESMRAIADSDLLHLVEMYSTMKPSNAAEIFDNMPAAFAAGFLREIDGARAGMIMSEMNAKKSFEISLIIASSNAHWR